MAGAFEELRAELTMDSSGVEEGVSSAENSLGGLKSIMGATGAAAAGMAAGGLAKSVSEFANFEAAMTESQAIMGDLTQNEMDAMEEKAREVGRTTTFSAEQAAESYFYLSSAGLDAAESTEVMGDMAQFAQAGAFDMATATDILTDAASAMNMEVSEYNDLADVLVKSNTLANATVEEFGTAMQRAGGRMADFNISAEEGAAVLSVWADQGLKGEKAGTAMNQTLRDLGRGARENADAWDELGVQVYDAEGEFRGMEPIVRDLEEATAGMSQEQRSAAMSTLGLTDEGARNLGMLLGQSEALAEYEGELQNAGGTAEEVAQNQLKSLSAQWNLLKSQISDVAIEIGGYLAPYLESLLSTVAGAVERFAAFNRETSGAAGALGLIGTAVGGTLVAMQTFLPVVANGTTLLGALKVAFLTLTGPIGLVTAATAALATAFATNFAGIRDSVIHVKDVIAYQFGTELQRIRDLAVGVASDIAASWRHHTSGVEEAVDSVVSYIEMHLVEGIVTAAATLRQTVIKMGWSWLQWRDDVDQAIGTIISTVGSLLSTLSGLGSKLGEHLGPAVAFVRDVFQATLESAFNSIKNAGQTLVDLVIDLGTRFGLLDENTSTAAEALGQLLDPFKKVELAISSVDEVFSTLTQAWDEDWLGIQTTVEGARESLGVAFSGMETDADTSFAGIQTSAQETLSGVFIRIEEEVGALREAWNSDFGELQTTLSETFGLLTQLTNEIVIPIFGTILSTVTESMSGISEVVDVHLGDILGEFVTTLNHLFENVINPALQQLLDAWDTWGDEILTVVELVMDTVMLVVETALDFLLTTLRTTLALLRGDWEGAWDLVEDYFGRTLDRILDFAGEWGGRLLDWIGGLVGDVIGWFEDLYHELVGGSIVPDMLSDILSAIKNTDVQGAFFDILDAAYRWIKNTAAPSFLSAGKGLVDAMVEGIKESPGAVKNAVEDIVGEARDLLPWSDAKEGPFDDLTGAGKAIPETIAKGARKNLGTLKDVLRTLPSPGPDSRPAARPTPRPAGGSSSVSVEIDAPDGSYLQKEWVEKKMSQKLEEYKREEERRKKRATGA